MEPSIPDTAENAHGRDPMSDRSERFRLGSWTIVPARGIVRSETVERRLTPQQMEVLVCLARRPGVVVEKEELLDEVWRDVIVEEGALSRSVSELRAALGDDARSPKYIQTVTGRGYRLILDPLPVEDEQPAGSNRKMWRNRGLLSLALVLVAFLVVGIQQGVVGRSILSWGVREGGATDSPGPVVAVLGFKNLSENEDTDWLSTAMPELLANELAVSDEIRVVPTQSVSRLSQDLAIPEGESLAPETLRQIEAALGADFVVLGSYLSVPGRLDRQIRLDARFQDTVTGEVLQTWTDTVPDEDVLSSLTRAGVFLRETLGVGGSGGSGREVAAYLPKDPTALRLYFQGIRSLRRFEATKARDYLSRSLSLEPDQPFGLLGLSQAYSALGFDEKARASAQSALELSGKLPREDRLQIEASFFAASSDWQEAIERYRALWLLRPRNIDYAILLAETQNKGGVPSQASSTLAELGTLESDLDARVLLVRARTALRLDEYEKALSLATEVGVKAEVLGSNLMLAKAREAQAIAFQRLGRVDEAASALDQARAEFRVAGDLASEAGALATKAQWLLDAGDSHGALELSTRALKGFRKVGDRRREAEALTQLGEIRSYWGDLSGANEALTSAVSVFVEIGDAFGQANALKVLGFSLGSNGHPHRSIAVLEEAAQIFERLDAAEQSASVDSVIGMTLYVVARPLEGHDYLAKAEERLSKLGNRLELATLQARMAESLWSLGRLVEAEERSRAALEASRELKNPKLAVFALVSLSRTLVHGGEIKAGIEAAQEGLKTAERLKMSTFDVGALVRMAEGAIALGAYERGLEMSRRALNKALESRKFLAGAHDGYARALIEIGDLAAAEEVLDAAVEYDDGFSDTSVELYLTRSRLVMRTTAPSRELSEELREVIETTKRNGYWPLEIDARIAYAELEWRSGGAVEANRILDAVLVETEKRGWRVLSQRARELLGRVTESPP